MQGKDTLTQLPRHWTRIPSQCKFKLTFTNKVERSVICTDITTYHRLDRVTQHSYSETFSSLAINDLKRNGNYRYHLL